MDLNQPTHEAATQRTFVQYQRLPARGPTPPAGSVTMIEAGGSGPGATGIDGHLPEPDGTPKPPATPTALAETAVYQDGHPIFVVTARADVYLAPGLTCRHRAEQVRTQTAVQRSGRRLYVPGELATCL